MTLGRNHYRHVYTYVYIYIHIYVNVYMHMYIYFYIYSIYQWFLNSFCIDWSNLLQIVFEFSEMWLFPEAAFIISVPPSNIWVLMQGSTTRKCKKACCFNHRLAAVPLLKKMWKNPIKTTLVVWYWIDCSCINQYLQHFLLILVCKLVLFSKDSRKGWTSPPLPQGPLAVWLCASKKSCDSSINGMGGRPWMAMTTSRHGFPRFWVFP